MAPLSAALTDEGKRRSSMDKAKVSHLSRQLQLRLQYARLKVEHGWHKQNLNEVENLYFRRTNNRPRQQSGFGPTTQTSYLSTSNIHPLAPQTLSFKAHTFSKVSEPAPVKMTNHPVVPFSSSPATGPSVDSSPPSSTAELSETQSSSQGAINPSSLTSSLSPSSSNIGPAIPSSVVSTMPSRAHTASTQETHQPIPSPSASAPAQTSTLHGPVIPLSARAMQKQRQTVKPIPLTSIAAAARPRSANTSSMPAYPASVSNPTRSVIPHFNQFTSTPVPLVDTMGRNVASLTYDSFWSSHNASVIANRPLSFRASVGPVGGKAGEFGAGIGPGIGSGVTAYPGAIHSGMDNTMSVNSLARISSDLVTAPNYSGSTLGLSQSF
ncbi:hypothetical protein C8J55DRAFT_562658 [Lentinula edodes]|uniref:Uncharacterized protein n=1 Tax=Lentinula lateritia TaxID=40482 RepID=A0A9W9A5D0_9AGAR|nr:hypothetical protein C8J55DRAFT_562658 [Lentinula edodes]